MFSALWSTVQSFDASRLGRFWKLWFVLSHLPRKIKFKIKRYNNIITDAAKELMLELQRSTPEFIRGRDVD